MHLNLNNNDVPEYTIVAFFNDVDSLKFLNKSANFPQSNLEQLPPHLTILNMIFTTYSPRKIIDEIRASMMYLKMESLEIDSHDVLIWYNKKYKGFTIATAADCKPQIFQLREEMIRKVKHITTNVQKNIWEKYEPHITISLSVEKNAADKAREFPSPSKMKIPITELQILKHGGDFFGYKKIAKIELDFPYNGRIFNL